MVRVAAERLGDDLIQLGFDFVDVLSRSETGAIADAEHMRVYRERFLAEGGVENDICGLAPNAGKRLQLLARARNLSAVLADQRLAECNQVFGLGVEQPDRLDRLA